MKGLKIIPLFLGLMILVFVGMRFVDANRQEVTVTFAHWESHPTALGFVVLTSALIGMVVCGTLCSVEIMALYVQNRKLRRKLVLLAQAQKAATARPSEPGDANMVGASHTP